MIKAILLLGLLTGCATYNFTTGNIPPSGLSRIQAGHKMSDIESFFGKPLLKENYMDTSALMIYASDYEENDTIDCRNVEIRLVNKNGEFVVRDVKVLEGQGSAKNRCYSYVAESEQNYNSSSNSWAAFFTGMSNSLNSIQPTERNVSSEKKFCYYGEYGGSPTCYSTLGSCQQSIRIYKGGACTIE